MKSVASARWCAYNPVQALGETRRRKSRYPTTTTALATKTQGRKKRSIKVDGTEAIWSVIFRVLTAVCDRWVWTNLLVARCLLVGLSVSVEGFG